MICSNSRRGCPYGTAEQPAEEFRGYGRRYRTCRTCRLNVQRRRRGLPLLKMSPRAKKNLNAELLDPWAPLCDWCLFDDCIRDAGDYTPYPCNRPDGIYFGCAIYEKWRTEHKMRYGLSDVVRGGVRSDRREVVLKT